VIIAFEVLAPVRSLKLAVVVYVLAILLLKDCAESVLTLVFACVFVGAGAGVVVFEPPPNNSFTLS